MYSTALVRMVDWEKIVSFRYEVMDEDKSEKDAKIYEKKVEIL